MRLHEIETEIAVLGARLEDWASEHDGDVTEFPFIAEMEGLAIERTRKLLSMGCLVKDIEGEAEALEREAANLKERARIKKNAANRIKGILSATLEPGERLHDERVEFAWKRSEAVEVDVPAESIPEEYRRVKVTTEADKSALKVALKDGAVIEGVRLVSRHNLQIK